MTGPPSGAEAVDHVVHRRCGRHDVVAVDRDVVDAVSARRVVRAARACWVGSRRELGVAVVLAEEDHRQLPHGREVHRFVERALRHRAVAEERHRHAAVGAELRGRRRAHRDRQTGRDDPVGAEDAEVGVGDVHRTAAAAVRARVLAHQLGEHPERVETLGQAVTVAAMGRRDHVGGAQRPTRPDRRRLLPDRQVHEAGHLAVAVERRHPLLEPADQEHPPVHLEEVGVGERGRSRRSRSADVHGRVLYWSVQIREGAMTDQIEIPASFPDGSDVTGKRVVITGAGRGLGRLLAHAFSDGGARVALVARTETDLKAVAEALPGPSLVLSGDVTDDEFNEAVADATVAEWGGVDVWICNAGISPIVAGPLARPIRRSGARCSR